MSKKESLPAIADELVISRIHTVRAQKVMLDRDLAGLYGVPTKALKQAIRRNADCFPEDFMFEMNKEEFNHWRSQIVTSNAGDRMGLRYAPFCFTEHGVLMISSVLNSETAIMVNIQIIRVFTRMRAMFATHKDVLVQLENLSGAVSHHSRDIKVIFHHLKRMEQEEKDRRLLTQIAKPKPRPTVGFKTGGKDLKH